MSRAYRISVSESVRRHVRVEDGFQVQLELLAVLPRQQMSELLAAQLLPLGFERDGELMQRSDEDGVAIEVDLSEGTVTTRLVSDKEVQITMERTRHIEEEALELGKAKLHQELQEDLEKGVERAREKLTEASTRILEQKLVDLRVELNVASNKTIAAALKVKAQQMGEIQEISENAETGEITIKVRI